ncbi:heavy metal transporter [Aeromicrobium panaciterrae]|uniref:hypothetical protein n=1 Tax=Aeromicrobium panaciterrae TaxID=363861 RepID=UPI0031D5D79A
MRLRWFVVLGLVAAGILVATGLRDREPLRSEFCVAKVGDVRAQVDLEQGQWAALMAAIAQNRGMSPRATTIAIATAFQESKIHNIDYGDRDSIGLFQQRPSQGWGTVAQIMDPHYSITRFYKALAKVKGYETMEITQAAQKVQRSGFPGAYAQHEADSRALASALRGYSPAAFTCQINPKGSGSVAVVIDDVEKAFGKIESAQDRDRARFPLTGKPADIEARGWAIAHYLVGNASQLGIETITFQTKQWNAEDSDQGWTTTDTADPDIVRVSTN